MDILERLKHGTAAEHRAVEDLVPLTDPELRIDDYGNYLASLVPFYTRMEGALRKTPGLTDAVPDLERRWKLPLIQADLRALERPSKSGPVPALPPIRNLAEALGVLYVLEGSTLGGQILVRMVRGRFGDQVNGKTNFLAAYAEETRAMWQSLCGALRQYLRTPEEQDAAITAAKATFSCFGTSLQSPKKSAA